MYERIVFLGLWKGVYGIYKTVVPVLRMIESMRMRWAGCVARMGAKTNRILVGKPEGKRELGRPRGRWVDNIKMDLREI
jgi:hypothetical protein